MSCRPYTIRKLSIETEQMQRLNQNSTDKNSFIPFTHERDHLGRLLPIKISITDLTAFSPSSSAQSINPKDVKVDENKKRIADTAKSALGNVFKHTPNLDHQNSKELRKKKILRAVSTPSIIPSIGYYDVARITDQLKYKRSQEVAFSKINPTTTFEKIPQYLISPKSRSKKMVCNEVRTGSFLKMQMQRKRQNSNNTVQLNYKLPQLQNYASMKKLTFNLCENFEKSHNKFKELVKKALGNVKQGAKLIMQ